MPREHHDLKNGVPHGVFKCDGYRSGHIFCMHRSRHPRPEARATTGVAPTRTSLDTVFSGSNHALPDS